MNIKVIKNKYNKSSFVRMSPSPDQKEKNGSKLQETLNNGDSKNIGPCPYCFPG